MRLSHAAQRPAIQQSGFTMLEVLISLLITVFGLLGLIGLHLYLVVRLGVSSPPWSREAAERQPDPEPTAPRSGLVKPAPRAAGVRRRPSE